MPTKNTKTFTAALTADLLYTDISTARKIQTPIREKKFLKSKLQGNMVVNCWQFHQVLWKLYPRQPLQ